MIKNKKISKRFIIVFLAFLLTFLFQYFVLRVGVMLPSLKFCAEQLKQGVMYGGDPFCAQGPVTYLLTAGITALFPLNSDLFMFFFYYVLFSCIFWLMLNVLKKEKQEQDFFLFLVLFVFFVILLNQGSAPSIFVTFFLFLGFYVLFYSSKRWKTLIVGVVFALAIHAKIIAFLYVGVILILYLIKQWREVNGSWLERFAVKDALNIVNVILTLSVILHFMFPNYLTYTLSVNVDTTATLRPVGFKNLLSTLEEMGREGGDLTDGWGVFDKGAFIASENVFLVLFFFFALLLFATNRKNVVSQFVFVGFVVFYGVLFYRFDVLEFRYFTPIFSMVPLSVMSIVPALERRSRIVLGIFLGLFFFVFAMMVQRNVLMNTEMFNELKQEVNDGILLIPENSTILIDDARLLLDVGYPLQSGRYDEYPEPARTFGPYDPFLLKLLLQHRPNIVKEHWRLGDSLVHINRTFIEKRIQNQSYDLIVIGVYGEQLLSLLQWAAETSSNPQESYPYQVMLPSLHAGCYGCNFLVYVFLKDRGKALRLHKASAEYYAQHFLSMCGKDKYVADKVVKPVMFLNSIVLKERLPFMNETASPLEVLLLKYYFAENITQMLTANMTGESLVRDSVQKNAEILDTVCETSSGYYRSSVGAGILNSSRDIMLLMSLLIGGMLFVRKCR